MCELTEFGGDVAECMHFDGPDNADAVYVISMGLVSNGVVMFELLNMTV